MLHLWQNTMFAEQFQTCNLNGTIYNCELLKLSGIFTILIYNSPSHGLYQHCQMFPIFISTANPYVGSCKTRDKRTGAKSTCS